LRHGRDERFLDRLLLASVVERRGAERFRLLAGALEAPDLAALYRGFWTGEAQHAELYARLAAEYFDEATIARRLDELAAIEAEVVGGLAPAPRLY
ncbi:MAG: tRNA-(ms[2]io[6]A)-hydroxylase, partial [Myxococcales bacterium]|nr:tRNA-(ms[2]io[6]A)-hydroxylase [Myxococcales bacterium]